MHNLCSALLNLPKEILYVILDFATDPSILALRSSCRSLVDITGCAFFGRFIAYRRVAFDNTVLDRIQRFTTGSKNDKLQTLEFHPAYMRFRPDQLAKFIPWLRSEGAKQRLVRCMRGIFSLNTLVFGNSDILRDDNDYTKMLIDYAVLNYLLDVISKVPHITTFRISTVSESVKIRGVRLLTSFQPDWPILHNISQLDITFPTDEDSDALERMPRHFPSLMHLCLRFSNLSNPPTISAIAKFERIRRIEMECLILEVSATCNLLRSLGKRLDLIAFRGVHLRQHNGWGVVFTSALQWQSRCRLTLTKCADTSDTSRREFSGSILLEDQHSVDINAVLNEFCHLQDRYYC